MSAPPPRAPLSVNTESGSALPSGPRTPTGTPPRPGSAGGRAPSSGGQRIGPYIVGKTLGVGSTGVCLLTRAFKKRGFHSNCLKPYTQHRPRKTRHPYRNLPKSWHQNYPQRIPPYHVIIHNHIHPALIKHLTTTEQKTRARNNYHETHPSPQRFTTIRRLRDR